MPDPSVEQAFQLALNKHQAGELGEAEALYRAILRRRPADADVIQMLGMVCCQTGRLDEGLSHFNVALELNPGAADYHYHLGNALAEMGRLEPAIDCFRKAIALESGFGEAFNNLGLALRKMGKPLEAIAAFRAGLKVDSKDRPGAAELHNNLANALLACGDRTEAIDQYRKSLTLRPSPSAHSNFLLALHYEDGAEPADIFAEHVRWDREYALPLKAEILPHSNSRDMKKVLRIGYVSPDFRGHSVAYFLENILGNHNTARFEIFAYSEVANADAVTARLEKRVHRWRTIAGLSHAHVANMIREDQIDILVDLAGHTEGNRLMMFVIKPAPVQVSYLGYPDTTGLSAIDYRLTDELADPAGSTEKFHTEKLVRLPGSFLCFCPQESAGEVSAAPCSRNGFVTFGSFNPLSKITERMIELWARILGEVKESRFIMKSATGLEEEGLRERLLDKFAAFGIDRARIELFGEIPSLAGHLDLYRRLDIALDTFPYHGTTTTCEALWMGVPVVTLAGRTHVSRVGVSLLSNIGMGELIADSLERYFAIATELGRDLPRIAEIHGSLREKMSRSALLNGKSFARNLESVYQEMWRQWCEGGR